MISVASSKLKITQRPALAAVVSAAQGGQPGARFGLRNGIEAVGAVTLHGATADVGTGWAAGFLQAQWIETNWAIYRGLQQAGGSVFVQRARPPARPHQACFDCITPGGAFYGSGAAPATVVPATGGPALPFVASLPARPAFPLALSVVHRDFPSDFYPFSRMNQTTHQMNFLAEVQLEFSFCISLVVKDSTGLLHFLQNLYWNVNWQNRFSPPVPGGAPQVTPVHGGNSANVGHVTAGRPTDHRFLAVLTTPQALNCNAVAAAAANNPKIRESAQWSNVDVRH
jgi:hypothetical protein